MSQQREVLNELMQLIRTLRNEQLGCEWHKKQTMRTLMPETLEEIYELLEAIDEESVDNIKDELGDVFFHILYYSQLADEQQWFTLNDLFVHMVEKITRRHPLIFNSKVGGANQDRSSSWEELKQKEPHRARNISEVNLALESQARPALLRAVAIQQQAKTTGFDWNEWQPILNKIKEETSELEAAIVEGESGQIHEELGDLLFACVNLARQCKVNPEYALYQANKKFIKRFSAMQKALTVEQKKAKKLTLEVWDKLWEAIKAQEKVLKT